MKQFGTFIAIAFASLILGSCATSNDVNNGHFFQKRKYTKGFHHGNLRINRSSAESATTAEQIESGKSSSKSESPVKKEVIVERAQEQVEATVVRPSDGEIAIAPHAGVLNKGTATTKKTEKPASAKSTPASRSGQLHKLIREERKQVVNKKEQQRPGGDSDLIFVLCIILAILLPPIAVLVWTNIDWIKVLIALLLTLLFILPGIIYALLVVLDKI